MTQIRLENVAFGYSHLLFSDVTLTISNQHRVGLVGNNGAGKSSLLKCISGEVEPTSGRVIRPKACRIHRVEQDLPAALESLSLRDVIAEALPEAERNFESWKVDVALDAFEAPQDLHDKPMRELSGGWRRLALIARAQIGDPDLLLLDEPTNHLDLAKIVTLENWIWDHAAGLPMVIISHDRRFLDNCTNHTLFVRPTRSAAYPCAFSAARLLLEADDRSAHARRDKELQEIRRLERSAHNLREIGKNNYSDEAALKSKQIAARARKLKDNLTEVAVETRRDIQLDSSELKRKWLIRIEDLAVHSPAGDLLFRIDKLDIAQDERIVLLGPNGSGKSSFLKVMRQAFANSPSARAMGIQITPQARPGYLDQHLSDLPLDKTIRDFVTGLGIVEQVAKGRLIEAGFAFHDQERRIRLLSHGERARLYLLALKLIRPNFYLLDEPTNHLDIAGQEQLEAAMIDDGSSCILVSHDRSFVDSVGTTFLLIRKGKLVIPSEAEARRYRERG